MQAIDKLKQRWNENPEAVIGVGALAATAAAQLINAVSSAQGRRAYAKDVDRRVRKQKYGR